ncbi:MAG: hypothetical protein QOJ56_5526 [Mycobacterium sp.]|jgi:hypothetical protein|nr:hypothetical protein [Mycobacterium sp.]
MVGDRPRATWCELRYWVGGRGNRVPGRIAACPAGMVAWAKNRLREMCGAVRFEIIGEVHRPACEVTRMPVSGNITWILGTYPPRSTGLLFPVTEVTRHVDRPPDG